MCNLDVLNISGDFEIKTEISLNACYLQSCLPLQNGDESLLDEFGQKEILFPHDYLRHPSNSRFYHYNAYISEEITIREYPEDEWTTRKVFHLMSLTPFLCPDLLSTYKTFVSQNLIKPLIQKAEGFFSKYRQDHFNQIIFLDTNSFLQKDLSLILNILSDHWTSYIPENTYISQFNRVTFIIQPDDFTFYTFHGHLFEKVLLSSTPTTSSIQSGVLLTSFLTSRSGFRDFVRINRGFSYFLIQNLYTFLKIASILS